MIGMAIGAARPITTRDNQHASIGPGFEPLPADRMGLAVPVIVGGRVVAVVYADAVASDGHSRHVPSSWPELIEVLARHAGRCLEALTNQKTSPRVPPPSTIVGSASVTPASGASGAPGPSALMQITEGVQAAARRTARLLVSDIRLFHEPAVTEGRRHRNLLSRLAPEIAKARQAYNEQVPAGLRAAHGLLSSGVDPDAGWRRRDTARQFSLTMKKKMLDSGVHSDERSKVPALVLGCALIAGVTLSAAQLVVPGRAGTVTPAKLSPTAHPPVPNDLSSMWLVPEQSTKLGPALTNFVRGVRLLEEDDRPAAALPLVSDGALSTTPRGRLRALLHRPGADASSSRYGEADTRVCGPRLAPDRRAPAGGRRVPTRLKSARPRRTTRARSPSTNPWSRRNSRSRRWPGCDWARRRSRRASRCDRSKRCSARITTIRRTAEARSRRRRARQTGCRSRCAPWRRRNWRAPKRCSRRAAGRRAKASYDRVKPFVTGNDRDRVAIRHRRRRHRDSAVIREGRDALRPYSRRPARRRGELPFRHRDARVEAEGRAHQRCRATFVEKFPASPFAEEVLNNLASAYIIDDQDAEADKVFRELLNRYPAGRFAERAAWKAGWWAYRQGQFVEALQFFDKGAAQFPRSDYRPSWLYWSARAAQQAGDVETGVARLRLTATDYHNSYYGRLAVKRLAGRARRRRSRRRCSGSRRRRRRFRRRSGSRRCCRSGLNREAMNELQYAQRVWGDSPQLQATIALTHRAARATCAPASTR